MSSDLAADITREFNLHGDDMVLMRTGQANLNVKGKRFGGSDAEIGNAAAQSEMTIKIGNAEIAAAAWPGPPARRDKIQIEGGTKTLSIQHVDTRKNGTEVLMHFLTCTG